MRLQLLGAAAALVEQNWVGLMPTRSYQLLVYLAYRGDWVSRDHLAFLFWPDHPGADARRNLRKTILRTKELEWATLEADPSKGLRWAVPTDVAEFSQHVQERRWAEAIAVYRGPLLPSIDDEASPEFSGWLELERTRLHTQWREALLARANELEQQGQLEAAVAVLGPLLEVSELDEEAMGRSMRLLSQARRSDAALWLYQEFARRLNQQLGLEPSSTLQTLAETIQAGTLPVAQTPQPLPTPSTAFVGRELELSELSKLLAQAECRLLTLIGPGGVGKTRTALKAAEGLSPHYSGGVFFVPLEALAASGQIAAKIAEVLNLSLSGKGQPLAQIIQHLGTKRLLLVLDNFEHLLSGASQLAELLQRCAGLQILATSRERLALEGEWLLPLEGLRFPGEESSLQDALSYDAVQLFVQRAHQVKPGFALSQTDLPALLEICHLTQGLPLALELAAAWVRILSCTEIAQEIRQNLDFLSSSGRDLPARQQSLRATFEHSWNLLVAKEQEALRRLSVFRGGFTREAARFVADVPLPLLASLVDKSLLRADLSGRYDSHPLLYEFTREKLSQYPQAELWQRHQNYFFELLKQQGEHFRSAQQKQALDTVQTDLENIRFAWQRAIRERNATDLSQAVGSLARFYLIRGRWREGVEACEQALIAFDPLEPGHRSLKATVLSNLAVLCGAQGDFESTMRHAQASLDLFAQSRTMHQAIGSLNILGIIHDDRGHYREARRYFSQALSLARKQQDQKRVVLLLSNIAWVEYEIGEYRKSRQNNLTIIETHRAQGDLTGLSISLSNLGEVLLAMGHIGEAQEAFEEGFALAKTTGIELVMPQLLIGLGMVRLMQQGYEEASSFLNRALNAAKTIGSLRREAESLDWLGYLALKQGNLEGAQTKLQQALQMNSTAGFAPGLLSSLTHFAELQLEQGDQEYAVHLLSLVMGHPGATQVNRDGAKRLLKHLNSPAVSGGVSVEEMVEQIIGGKRKKEGKSMS